MRHRPFERGSALVEFAIVVPLFVTLVYGALYLTDLGVFKLRAQEIAHYGAWAMATQPLSNYDDSNFRHARSFDDARDRIAEELASTYSDLNGARDVFLPGDGKNARTMSAVYEPPQASDIRNQAADIIPTWGELPFVSGTDVAASLALNFLGVGTSLESMVSGMAAGLGMNDKGQITARADVKVLPPWRADRAAEARQMAELGKTRGADLSAFNPRGEVLKDGDERISTTLIADNWRLAQGHSATPHTEQAAYNRVVAHVGANALRGLPGGTLVDAIVRLLNITNELPDGVQQFIPGSPQRLRGQVFSRPYVANRQGTANYTGTPKTGQVNIFAFTRGSAENGAVTNFETGALFDDPNNLGGSEYLKALNNRGPNFMGCQDVETRGCWQ